MFNYTLFFSLSLLFLSVTVFSQDYREAYNNFDNLVSKENTNLIYGKEYVEQHATINNQHKFFKTSGLLNGNVVYSGQTYFDLDLKYNVFDDLLIVKIKKQAGDATFELFKNRIESFSIDGHNFLNIPPKETTGIRGFYEVLREIPSLKLLKDHRKKINKKLTQTFTYFEFKDEQAHYVIAISEEYFHANSQSDWCRVFPKYSEEIKKFFNSYKALKENDPDSFMSRLFLEISESYQPNNS